MTQRPDQKERSSCVNEPFSTKDMIDLLRETGLGCKFNLEIVMDHIEHLEAR